MINCIHLAIIFLLGIKHDQNLATDYNFKFAVDFQVKISVSQISFASVIYICVLVCMLCVCVCVCVLYHISMCIDIDTIYNYLQPLL